MIVRIILLLASEWPKLVLAGLAGALTVIANAALIATSAYLISLAALHPPLAALSVPIAGVRFFGIARAVLRYVERLFGHAASLKLLTRLQVWFYAAVEPHIPAALSGYRTADLWQRLVNDVEILKFLYVKVVHPPFVALAVLLAASWFLGRFSWQIAVGLGSGFILSGLIVPAIGRHYGEKFAADLADRKGGFSSNLQDAIGGMEELVTYGMVDRHLALVDEQAQAIEALQAKMTRIQAAADAVSGTIANLTVFVTLLQSVNLVQQARLDGVLLAVIPLLVQCSFEAVWPLAHLGSNYAEMRAAAGRLFAVIDSSSALPDGEQSVSLANSGCELCVEALSYTYPGRSLPALAELSFQLPPGKKMAVVGPSGAGKSTLAALLLRLADYDTGRIYLNGQELRSCSQQEVRAVFGVVNQDIYLFHATVRDNLLLARPTASDEELWSVLRRACLAETIAALPQQLETVIGREGLLLSGGERQRLAIARALLKNTPLLLFDEPVTGIDPATAEQIMAIVHELPKDKSLILITHCLAGLENMDEILVMDNGKVVERGTMQQLCTRQGLFYRMLLLQCDSIAE